MGPRPRILMTGRKVLAILGVSAGLAVGSLAWAGPPSIVWQTSDGAGTVAYSKDGSLIADAGVLITIRRAVDGALVTTLRHKSGINSVAFSPDGTLIADGRTNGSSGNIRIYRISDGFITASPAGHNNATRRVLFSADGLSLASGGDDRTAKIWRVSDGALLRTLQAPSRVRALALTSDGATLATGDLSGAVVLWRYSDGAMLRKLTGFSSSVSDVAFSPSRTLVAAASLDGSVRLWRVSDGGLVRVLKLPGSTPNGSATALAFSVDGSVLLVGTDEVTPSPEHGALRFYRVSDGALLKTFDRQADVYVSSVAFSPGGQTFAYTRTVDGELTVAANPF
jgi:WD40 repeat protein